MIDKIAQNFYDDIAIYYDDMTRFQERLAGEKQTMQGWVDKYQFQTVLDAACGSGLHSIVLHMLGINVNGVDISAQMIARASKNAQDLGVNIPFKESAIDKIDQKIKKIFDSVLILGNSLPHLKSAEELKSALASIEKVLADKGYLIIQILNYEQILKEKQRIVTITRNNNHEFIRFYDFVEPLIRFNVLHIHWENGIPRHRLASTMLYPYTLNELSKILVDAGYSIRNLYGSMKFDSYDSEHSKNLIIVVQTI